MKRLVLTSFITSNPDPQRKISWEPSIDKVMPLVNSVTSFNESIVVFHDCFDSTPKLKNVIWNKVEAKSHFVPNVQRWFYSLEYLKKNQHDIDYVFMVDSTDVEMLTNPFPFIKKDTVYTGNERGKTVRGMERKWLTSRIGKLSQEFQKDYRKIISEVKTDVALINCGIFGCDRKLAIEFLEKLCLYHEKYSVNIAESTDTPIYVYTLLKHYRDRFQQGTPINTVFKGNEYDYSCWWKHK